MDVGPTTQWICPLERIETKKCVICLLRFYERIALINLLFKILRVIYFAGIVSRKVVCYEKSKLYCIFSKLPHISLKTSITYSGIGMKQLYRPGSDGMLTLSWFIALRGIGSRQSLSEMSSFYDYVRLYCPTS